jgi:hypothetical protein
MALKYLFTPKRRLESARKQKRFLLIDNEDVRKNFFLTYKGTVFTGEKYKGDTDTTYDVISISIRSDDPESLKGFSNDDFYFIDKKILEKYPKAEIHWKSPVKEF